MKPGDLVKIRNNPGTSFDWKEPGTGLSGYWLRELKSLNLLKHGQGDFSTKDLCLIVELHRAHALVLTPRHQMGLIHVDKLEVVSESR